MRQRIRPENNGVIDMSVFLLHAHDNNLEFATTSEDYFFTLVTYLSLEEQKEQNHSSIRKYALYKANKIIAFWQNYILHDLIFFFASL